MKWKCIHCGKEMDLIPSRAKKRKYCSTSCQLKHEYSIGKRDRVKTGEKARIASYKRMKQDNWLNYNSSRDKLRKVMNTEEYRKRAREDKLGEKNGMYNKKPWNFLGIDKRNKYGNVDRGFDWKRIKRKVKERDNYTCQHCGETEEDTKQYLQVHHITKYSIFQDNSMNNLITLCPKCHAHAESQFLKIRSIKKINVGVLVFNLSVDEDESYVAENLIVHNCRSTIVFRPN